MKELVNEQMWKGDKYMKKILLSVILALIIVCSHSSVVLAQENDIVKNPSSDNDTEPQRINRTGTCYCLGGGSWGHITGDNNAFGEGVYVTNLTTKTIEVKGYSENGTLRGSNTIASGQRGWFGFWLWDGTYYFKVRFQDLSEGEITIYMKSDWYID